MQFSVVRTLVVGFGFALSALTGCAPVDDSTPEVSNAQEARASCYSSDDCGAGQYCTTEDGVCNSPCRPNQICIQVCTGTCRRDNRRSNTCDYNDPSKTWVNRDAAQCAAIRFTCDEGMQHFFNDCGCGCEPVGEPCGATQCESGQVCCNASCGICTPPGGVCTQQLCTSVPLAE
jgi:hypothetical protein